MADDREHDEHAHDQLARHHHPHDGRGPDAATLRYGLPGYGAGLVALVALTAASGLAMVLRCQEPAWADAAWLAVIAAAGWVLLARAVHRIDLDGATLRWHTPLHHGELPLAGVRTVKGAVGGFATISTTGPTLWVLAHRGITDLAAAIEAGGGPDVRVELGLHARLCERFGLVRWTRG